MGFKHHCYEDRLAQCKLSTLKDRRLSGDWIQVFRLLEGLEQINYNNFFVIDENTSRRGHTLKLAKPRARFDIRLRSFSHSVINYLHNLSVEFVE